MENEDIKYKIILSDVLVNKLESISTDIKYYINMNAVSLNADESIKCLNKEDKEWLLYLQSQIKLLAFKLKYKLEN